VRDPRRKRPSKRIKSRGLAEKQDQAKKKALERLKRQQEKEKRKRERELARLMRLRFGTRRGSGSWLYTLDEREEVDAQKDDRQREHQAGSLANAGGSRQPPTMAGMHSLRKRQRKALQKLKRVG
jgi:hypothetical protein